MSKVIGLTGGIGSGKTTVAKIFESKGIPIYISDDQAKKILDRDDVILEVVEIFGEDIIENNKINRRLLSSIVFSDKDKLNRLNKIIHHRVGEHFNKWLEEQKSKFIIKETAILFEYGLEKFCDKVIVVTAPLETRIDRCINRDGSTRESIMSRIDNQLPEIDKVNKADFVINNITIEQTTQDVIDIIDILNK